VNKAKSAGLTPYITFINQNTRSGSGPYATEVDRLWQTKPFSDVKYWGATNEPDLMDPVLKRNVNLAVAIWRAVKRKANTKNPGASQSHCPGCHIVAGEFALDLPGQFSDTYVQQYMDGLNSGTSHPHYWAQHDYYDMYHGPSTVKDSHGKKHKYTFLMLHQFISNLDKRGSFGGRRAHILMSEGGVLLRHSSSLPPTRLNDNRANQVQASKTFLKMRSRARIEMVNYYEIFGETGGFDSAVVTPQSRGPLDARRFRPVYCLLTGRGDDPAFCPAVHSCTAGDPNPNC
jgi:hypothetical protein